MTHQGSASTRRRRDDGFSLVEVVVAIVLLGGVTVGTLGALRTTIFGGTLQRDHANAHAWLQSASDVLYAAPKVPCNPSTADGDEPAVRAAYDAIVDGVANPEGWSDWQIKVLPTVQFWNASDVNGDRVPEYTFGPDCQEDVGLSLQLIRIEVRAPSGRIVETVEIVK